MVATVELFQGKEKPIILVSTTRCQMGGIGFLNSPQVIYFMIHYLLVSKYIILFFSV